MDGTLEYKVKRLIHLQQQLWGNMELTTSQGSSLTHHTTVSKDTKVDFPLTERFLNFETVIQNLLIKAKPLSEIRYNILRRVLFSCIQYGIWERLIHVFIKQFQTVNFHTTTIDDSSTTLALLTLVQKSFKVLLTVLFSWISQCQLHSIPEALVQTYIQIQIATSVYFPYLSCILLSGDSKKVSFFCCRLARYLGKWCDKTTTLFLHLWQGVNATERLRFLLTLGPIECVPQALLCAPLGGFEYPTDRVVFSSAPQPSLAFTMDRTSRLSHFQVYPMLMCAHNANPLPQLLDFYTGSNEVNGVIWNSSSLYLCVSTIHNVYQINLVESLLREPSQTSLDSDMDWNDTFMKDPSMDCFSQWVQKLYHEYVASEIQLKTPFYHNCCITNENLNTFAHNIMLFFYFLFPSMCLTNIRLSHPKNHSRIMSALVQSKNDEFSSKDTDKTQLQKVRKPPSVVPHWINELSQLERMPSYDLEKISSTIPFHYLFLLKGLLIPLTTFAFSKPLKLQSQTETTDILTPQSDTEISYKDKQNLDRENLTNDFMTFPFSIQNNLTSSFHETISQGNSFLQLLTRQHADFLKHQIDILKSCFFKISKVYKSKNTSQATNLQSFSLETSSLSHLHSHPFLPLYIGAITESHVSYTPVGTPVIILAQFGSLTSEILGVLMLPIKKLIKSTKQVTTNSIHLEENDVTQKLSNQTDSSLLLTYQKAGAIESLKWNDTGTRIISSHANGWACIWKFPLSHIDRVDKFTSDVDEEMSSTLHSTSVCTKLNSNNKSLLSRSPAHFPSFVFKPHTSYCFLARFLYTGDSHNEHLLVTSGLGMEPTLVVEIHPKKSSTTIFFEPNMGILCIWDIRNNELLQFPQLLQYDASFSINNYATDIAVWHAKQLLIYSDRHGYVRIMNLKQRELNNILYLIHPPTVYSIYKKMCLANSNNNLSSNWQLEKLFLNSDKDLVKSKRIEEYVGKDSASPKALKKEIVKIFLLTKTQRLVACYEDSLIRVWDISSLEQNNLINVFQNTQQNIYNYPLDPHDKTTKSIRMFYPSTGCPPLLWEATKLLHIPDPSKNSLISSFMGAVINITPTKTPFPALLDAYMPSPYHLVTLGTDGTVAMTRL
ncbi:uncharacterized protein LOC128883696 [Hylaeus volcanicus]|uniref:uncharacterized protein LOC128883696 n=1 Tax=Hylaeus volcanicus TaxID=313075 RepID=UPI0023B7A65E|nr:uncharacterized protein LOC128883696 [Hylaeus volcanicus]